MALLSLKLGAFLPGIAGADLGNPCGKGRLIPPGNRRFPGRPPGITPPGFMFMLILPRLDIGDPGPMGLAPAPGGAMPIRCCCRARAFAMISSGRLVALGGGLRALFNVPVTLELALMWPPCWGSDTVRRDGTLRGESAVEKPGAASELELGGSYGVLASEESSIDPGDTGLLSLYSSGVSGAGSESES